MDEEELERLLSRVDVLEVKLGAMRRASVRNRRFGYGGMAAVIVTVIGAWWVHEEVDKIDWVVRQANSNAQNAMSVAGNVQAASRHAAATPPVFERAFEPIVRAGKVSKVEGESPVSQGASCTVKVISAGMGDLNCRVLVRCGERHLYGMSGAGYLICNMEDGLPTFGRDEDGSSARSAKDSGDPMFELDLPNDRVVVSDGPSSSYSVEIALSQTP